MSTSSVGEAAHLGRRVSAFFGRTSAFMSALSIGHAACFGRMSAFFSRTSVFMSALCFGDAACFGHVSAFFGRASVLPALGRAFVLVLGARPVAFVGPAAVEVLRIAVGRIAVGVNP